MSLLKRCLLFVKKYWADLFIAALIISGIISLLVIYAPYLSFELAEIHAHPTI